MSIKDKIFEKRVSGIFNVLNIILSVVCMVFYSVKAIALNEFNSQVDIFLVLTIICCAIYVFVNHPAADIANFVAVIFITLAIGKLIVSSINTFADALNGISMFGSSGQIGHIILAAVLLVVMLLLEIVSCFLSRDKKTA